MIYKSKHTAAQIEEVLDFHDWEYLYDSVGDIVYHDGTKLNSIPYTEWEDSLGTPIGIIVIPSGLLGDARIIALEEAMCQWDPDSQFYNWGLVIRTSDDNLYGSWDDPVYLPSDHFDDCENPCDPTTHYHSDSECDKSKQAPPIYSDGRLFYPFTKYNFSGAWATYKEEALALLNSAADYCRNFEVEGVKDWYLPTCGELAFCLYHMDTINKALAAVKGYGLEEHEYWTVDEEEIFTTYLVEDDPDAGYLELALSLAIDFRNGKICIVPRDLDKAVRPFRIWK